MRALQLLETEDPDIVLLDLMLPEADGFELCRQIRERSPVAIIVVSARGGERDKVTALHMGADDYLTKPFSIEELLARITATLRRTRPAAPTEQQAPPVIVVGDVVIDLALQQVRRNGQPVHLTPTEFALLRELAVNRGKLLTHAHLLRRVWGHGYETETEYLRVYVRRLRAKLEAEESAPLILTQPRAGYRLAPGLSAEAPADNVRVTNANQFEHEKDSAFTVSSRRAADVKVTLIPGVLGSYKRYARATADGPTAALGAATSRQVPASAYSDAFT
jgi:two-component system KDP operon response regulator KdpE